MRPRALQSAAPTDPRAISVTLADPVVAAFAQTTLLKPIDTPSKLAARLKLDLACSDPVAAAASPVAYPGPTLPRTELDDPHTLPSGPLPPTRLRTLASAAPIDRPTSVTLTDPDPTALVFVKLLTETDATP